MAESVVPRHAVIVDDDLFTRSFVASRLDQLGFRTHPAATVTEALVAIEDVDADIAIVDLDLGEGPSGADLVHGLSRDKPWVAVVILTSFASARLVSRTEVPAGIPYVVKSDLPASDLLEQAVDAALTEGEFTTEGGSSGLVVTPRQADVLRLIARGCSNERIAGRLDMTIRAVEQSVRRLYERLNLHTDDTTNPRVQAALLYRDARITVRGRR